MTTQANIDKNGLRIQTDRFILVMDGDGNFTGTKSPTYAPLALLSGYNNNLQNGATGIDPYTLTTGSDDTNASFGLRIQNTDIYIKALFGFNPGDRFEAVITYLY